LLNLATKGIEEKNPTPSEADVIEGVWNGFATRTVHPTEYDLAKGEFKNTTQDMEYWENVTPEPLEKEAEKKEELECSISPVKGLLESKKGKCEAWAEAFAYTLGYEGIHSKVEEIRTNFTECVSKDACFFLVNNWEFKCNGAKKSGNFPYPGTEVVDLEGVSGQGTKNPPGAFFNHFITRIKETIYDPSYGTPPVGGGSSLQEYQEASIAGYCKNVSPRECQPEEKNALKVMELNGKEF